MTEHAPPAPGSKWRHKRDRGRICQVVRVRDSDGGINSASLIVDYKYVRTVGGMGSNRTTPVQSMPLELWRRIFPGQEHAR